MVDFPAERRLSAAGTNGRAKVSDVSATDRAIDDYKADRAADRRETRIWRIVGTASALALVGGALAIAGAINSLAGIVQSKEVKCQVPPPGSPSTSPPTQGR